MCVCIVSPYISIAESYDMICNYPLKSPYGSWQFGNNNNNIAHRDLKPSAIISNNKAQESISRIYAKKPKLTDFVRVVRQSADEVYYSV